MGSRRRHLFILAFVVGLLCASIVAIAQRETQLGLDLRGGTQIIYEGRPGPGETEVSDEDMELAMERIRERVDRFGVAEPEIQRLGVEQIQVGLPDVRDAERAIDRIGATSQLFFYDWEQNVVPPGRDGSGDAGTGPLDVNSEEQQQAADAPIRDEYEAVQLAAAQPRSDRELVSASDQFYLVDPEGEEVLVGPEQEREDLVVDYEGAELDPDGEIVQTGEGSAPPESAEIVVVPQGTIVVEDAEDRDPEREDDEENGEDSLGPEGAVPGSPGAGPPERPDGPFFVLRDAPALSGDNLRDPEQQFDPRDNTPNVTFQFDDEGRRAFQEVTRELAQRGFGLQLPGAPTQQSVQSFAIVLDGQVVSRPIIDFNENPDGIDGRTGAQISGNFTIESAQELADFLRIGALPVELRPISTSTVSATLGQAALEQGLRAGLLGLGLVLIFLISFYRLLGVIAGLALVTYALLFFALIKLVPITLTLPGIAGLILTIGIASDSNVVIFERVKEEVRAGRSIPNAIALGYRRGIATIIDANIVTLLTAFILFVLATAGVKGFAFTLGVGTLVSLFTAVVFTQAILGNLSKTRLLARPSVLGADPNARQRWNWDWVGRSQIFFASSGIVLLIGAISLSTQQLNLGIDFESGTRVTASLEREASVQEVRETMRPLGLADATIAEAEDPDFGENVIQLSTGQIEEGEAGGEQVITALDEEFGVADRDFQTVGPTFGAAVASSAIWAIVMSMLLISAYVAFRFEPKFAVPVLLGVVHDLLITAGIYSLLGLEMTSATVAALLTILGYSLYDTIIVFDRIRENAPRMPRAAFSQIANRSVSQVFTRTLATTVSTMVPVTCLFLFGGETLRDFAIALMIGLLSGAYSTIFIEVPALCFWKEREPGFRLRRERLIETMGYVPTFPEENVAARLSDEERGAEEEEEKVAGPSPVRTAPEPREAPPARTVDTGPDGGGGGAAGSAEPEAEALVGSDPEPRSPQPKGSKPKSKRKKSRPNRGKRRKHGKPR